MAVPVVGPGSSLIRLVQLFTVRGARKAVLAGPGIVASGAFTAQRSVLPGATHGLQLRDDDLQDATWEDAEWQ